MQLLAAEYTYQSSGLGVTDSEGASTEEERNATTFEDSKSDLDV